MIRLFKRRRPAPRPVPDQISLHDLLILRWYGYSPAQWTALPELVKVDKRESIRRKRTTTNDPLPRLNSAVLGIPSARRSRPASTYQGQRSPALDHDHLKENWSRRTNKYCDCPPWRYNPRHPKPTNPECEIHGMASTSQPPRRDLYEIEQETKAAAERLFSSPDKDDE